MDRLVALCAVLVLFGCADLNSTRPAPAGLGSPGLTSPVDSGTATPADPAVDASAVLAFLNDASTSRDLLDHDVGLDARAAANLVAHRAGDDGLYPSADDDPFDSLDEVDAVEWVGEATLARLVAYVDALGAAHGDDDLYGSFDGVAFTWAEAEATVAYVNASTFAFLDDELGLDVRAARGVVDEQPIADLAHLAGIAFVGRATLADLRAAATAPPPLGATTGELIADPAWQVSDIAQFDAALELHWLSAEQLVVGGRALGFAVEDAAELFALVDTDGVHLAQITGSPSPYAYDWYTFHHDDREVGLVFVEGRTDLVALVWDGELLHAW